MMLKVAEFLCNDEQTAAITLERVPTHTTK